MEMIAKSVAYAQTVHIVNSGIRPDGSPSPEIIHEAVTKPIQVYGSSEGLCVVHEKYYQLHSFRHLKFLNIVPWEDGVE